MATRGRKSIAELTVVKTLGDSGKSFSVARIPPPPELTHEQARIWIAICNEKPADWFSSETVPLLAAYCKAITSYRCISLQIDSFSPEWLVDDEGIKRYDKLTTIQARQAGVMLSLATRMRLTQQSRYTPRASVTAHKRSGIGSRPWEFNGKDETPDEG